MRSVFAVLIACILSAGVVITLLLRGPAWAWWHNPLALGVLVVMGPLLVAILMPRSWWRT